MTISFSIQNSFELRTIVDALTYSFEEIAKDRLFKDDDTLTKITRGLAIDRIADDMIGSYNDNKESAEFAVVATDLSHDNNGVYDHIECEYCQNRKEAVDAINLFVAKGYSEDEIKIKRLNFIRADDTFYDDDGTESADNNDDDDYDSSDYCNDFS